MLTYGLSSEECITIYQKIFSFCEDSVALHLCFSGIHTRTNRDKIGAVIFAKCRNIQIAKNETEM